jgi:hypothetical protein
MRTGFLDRNDFFSALRRGSASAVLGKFMQPTLDEHVGDDPQKLFENASFAQ